MAMKELVEGECGGLNPLMRATSHFYDDKGRQEILHRHVELAEDQLVHEFINRDGYQDAPQTFRMDSLLQQMNELEKTVSHPSEYGASSQWVNEFMSSRGEKPAEEWINEYSRFHAHGGPANGGSKEYEGLPHTKWASEYLDRVGYSLQSETPTVEETARELLAKVDDPELWSSQFMSYVKKIEDGSGDKVSKETKSSELAKDWVDEYASETLSADEEAAKWAEKYALSESDMDYWHKLQKEWDELQRDELDESHPWLQEYQSEYEKDYTFEEDNPFNGTFNAFEEGLKKLKEGDLISAILLFEEEVKENPDHAEAWQYLGTSQAENEQEMPAIRALNRCIKIQPDNLTAHMSLAVSYTNESLQIQACNALKDWLRHNARYSSLLQRNEASGSAGATGRISSLMTKQDFDEVHDLYIAAAQMSPENIDGDIQVGLGILFNLSGEYEKAVDCFQTGLQANPTDPQLWNKVGATLANSGRSEEAVDSYRQALELSPGFIRCRYNLGISCINLGAHREAVEHFLTALNMQRKGENPSGVITTMSDNIWSTLRMAVSLMGRTDLAPYISKRDLGHLNKEFNMHD